MTAAQLSLDFDACDFGNGVDANGDPIEDTEEQEWAEAERLWAQQAPKRGER